MQNSLIAETALKTQISEKEIKEGKEKERKKGKMRNAVIQFEKSRLPCL